METVLNDAGHRKNGWKSKTLFVLIIIAYFVAFAVIYVKYVSPVDSAILYGLNYDICNMERPEASMGVMKAGDVFTQILRIDKKIEGIAVMLGTYMRTNTNHIRLLVKDRDTGEIYYDSSISAEILKDNMFHSFVFNKPVDGSETEKTIEITFVSPDASDANTVAIYKSVSDKFTRGELFKNGERQEGNITFIAVIDGVDSVTLQVCILLAFIALTSVILLYWGLVFRNWKFENLLFIAVISLGLMSGIIFTSFTIPDEFAHILAPYQYSNLLLGKEINQMREADAREHNIMKEKLRPVQHNYGIIVRDFNFFDNSAGWVSFNGGVYSVLGGINPVGYFFTTIGMTVSKILGLGYFPMHYFSKILNLLFFAFCVWLAARIIPFGKPVVFAVAAMPMTIHQISSFSYDAVTFGLAIVFIAYILSLSYKEGPIRYKELALIFLLGILLGSVKIVYFTLVLLCFLVPYKKYGSKKRWFLISICIFVASAAVSVLANWTIINSTVTKTADAIMIHSRTPGYTVSWVLSHPLEVLKLYWNTLYTLWGSFFLAMIGSSFSWVTVHPNLYLIKLYLLGLLASSIKWKEDRFTLSIYQKSYLLFVIIAVVSIIFMSLLVYWTPMGNVIIEGIQGRYFIPVLPLILLLLRSDYIKISGGGFVAKSIAAITFMLSQWVFISAFIYVLGML